METSYVPGVADAGAGRSFLVGAVLAGAAVALFLSWILAGVGGSHTTLQVDDVGQWVAAWCATAVCCVAAVRVPRARATWALFAVSSFAWGAGEAVWCYYALVRNVPVPFPSLADVGFLCAIPPAFAALLVYPGARRGTGDRGLGLLDSCIIATSLLFASWATILGPMFRAHQGTVLKQVISLAYPMSDVVMVSLVIILIARGGRPVRVDIALVMAGVVAFAVADSSFTYLTGVNDYSGGSFLDTGWVAGYLLIALGGLWAVTSPRTVPDQIEGSTASLVAPYVPVLIVLAVTSVQLLRGKQMEPVSWLMALALVLMVLGREALNMWYRTAGDRRGQPGGEPPADRPRSLDPGIDAVAAGR
ncbi:MAG: hypothetical protein ABSF84_08410 [Acidimicrobiales bacterium]|jgi:hypothetical protein